MMLKLKLQYFGHLMRRVDSLEKNSDAGRDWGQEEKGTTEDEMAGWHHWLDGRESECTPGVGDGQGGLACCDSWGPKESDVTERLNWTEWMILFCQNDIFSSIKTADNILRIVDDSFSYRFSWLKVQVFKIYLSVWWPSLTHKPYFFVCS